MEEDKNKNVVNHFEAGSNCQVFNAPVSGCVFAMPGSTVTQHAPQQASDATPEGQESKAEERDDSGEELCHFVHPSVDSTQEWQIHDEIRRLVKRQRIQEICQHLLQLKRDGKVLLPQSPSAAYEELVRLGMPNGEGFNESTFRKYYSNK